MNIQVRPEPCVPKTVPFWKAHLTEVGHDTLLSFLESMVQAKEAGNVMPTNNPKKRTIGFTTVGGESHSITFAVMKAGAGPSETAAFAKACQDLGVTEDELFDKLGTNQGLGELIDGEDWALFFKEAPSPESSLEGLWDHLIPEPEEPEVLDWVRPPTGD